MDVVALAALGATPAANKEKATALVRRVVALAVTQGASGAGASM